MTTRSAIFVGGPLHGETRDVETTPEQMLFPFKDRTLRNGVHFYDKVVQTPKCHYFVYEYSTSEVYC